MTDEYVKSRTRGYCFTINNYGDDDIAGVMAMAEEGARYVIAGFEVGDNEATPHIQGYVYFQQPISFKSISERWLRRAHIEPARAVGSKAFRRAEYCKKDGSYWESGTEPTPGRLGEEYIKELMSDPYSNIHLYNQYYKTYRRLELNKERKEKKIISRDILNKYAVAKEFAEQGKTVFMDPDLDTYDGEDVLFINVFHSYNVMDWYNGFPPRIKRGYEIIMINPEIVVLFYSNVKEYNTIRSRYLDILTI